MAEEEEEVWASSCLRDAVILAVTSHAHKQTQTTGDRLTKLITRSSKDFPLEGGLLQQESQIGQLIILHQSVLDYVAQEVRAGRISDDLSKAHFLGLHMDALAIIHTQSAPDTRAPGTPVGGERSLAEAIAYNGALHPETVEEEQGEPGPQR